MAGILKNVAIKTKATRLSSIETKVMGYAYPSIEEILNNPNPQNKQFVEELRKEVDASSLNSKQLEAVNNKIKELKRVSRQLDPKWQKLYETRQEALTRPVHKGANGRSIKLAKFHSVEDQLLSKIDRMNSKPVKVFTGKELEKRHLVYLHIKNKREEKAFFKELKKKRKEKKALEDKARQMTSFKEAMAKIGHKDVFAIDIAKVQKIALEKNLHLPSVFKGRRKDNDLIYQSFTLIRRMLGMIE